MQGMQDKELVLKVLYDLIDSLNGVSDQSEGESSEMSEAPELESAEMPAEPKAEMKVSSVEIEPKKPMEDEEMKRLRKSPNYLGK